MASVRFVSDRDLTAMAGPWSDPGRLGGFVVRCLAAAAAAAAVTCGSVLFVRRLGAALTVASGPGVILAVAGLGVLLSLVADLGRRQGGGLVGPAAARIGFALAVAAVVTTPRTPAGWFAVLLACSAAAVTTLRRPGRPTGSGGPVPPRVRSREPRRGSTPSLPNPAATPARRSLPRGRGPRRVLQRFERCELPGGGDRLRGWITIGVPAGAKLAHGHVGFCPAFGETPRVTVSTDYDGVEATVLAAEVLPWGVRVECRLAEPAEEAIEIPVDLVADVAAST